MPTPLPTTCRGRGVPDPKASQLTHGKEGGSGPLRPWKDVYLRQDRLQQARSALPGLRKLQQWLQDQVNVSACSTCPSPARSPHLSPHGPPRPPSTAHDFAASEVPPLVPLHPTPLLPRLREGPRQNLMSLPFIKTLPWPPTPSEEKPWPSSPDTHVSGLVPASRPDPSQPLHQAFRSLSPRSPSAVPALSQVQFPAHLDPWGPKTQGNKNSPLGDTTDV